MSEERMSLPGVAVGHWTHHEAQTGCTVIRLPEGSVGAVEIRGGAPASRELDVLSVDKTVAQIDAVLLTGGSAFGLAAADGVMQYLEEQGRGVPTPAGVVPIVPALGLYDLAVGQAVTRPEAKHGYLAARDATEGVVVTGAMGAGTGAYAGNWRGAAGHYPGGIVYAERRYHDVVVGALFAVNAFGDVGESTADTASVLAALTAMEPGAKTSRSNTTIGVVLTNARLDKVACHVVAQGGHDGLARALHPPHTRFDGDAVIAASVGEVSAHVDVVRLLAVQAVNAAIRQVER
ncbi:P1 family peptidase [Glutamicibacter sp. X7]